MTISVYYKVKRDPYVYRTWFNSVDDMLHHMYFKHLDCLRIDYNKGDYFDIPMDYYEFELLKSRRKFFKRA